MLSSNQIIISLLSYSQKTSLLSSNQIVQYLQKQRIMLSSIQMITLKSLLTKAWYVCL